MRVATVFGPSQAGKSTLVAALSALDRSPAATFEVSDVARVHCFSFMDEPWAMIDIAGGSENLAAAGPALAGSDAVVLCAMADADAAVLSAPFLRLMQESGVPGLVFVNGVDRATDRVRDIVAALQTYSGHGIVLRQMPLRSGGELVGAVDLISERAWKYREGQPSQLIELPEDALPRERSARAELLESLADFDDTLLEELIEDRQPMTDEVYGIARRTLQEGDLVPAVLGSASHRNGILRLMKLLRHEAPAVEAARQRLSDGDAADAVGLAADIAKHLGKTVLMRALGATLRPGEALGGPSVGSLTGLDARTAVAALEPGEIGLAIKSDHLRLGQVYSREAGRRFPSWAEPHPPGYARIVAPVQDRDQARYSAALDRLSDVDIGFTMTPHEGTGRTVLATQGPLHLRRLVRKLADGFGVEVEEQPIPLSLRETAAGALEWHHRHRKQTGGAGQFADVLIELRPEPRGSGNRFEEQVKGGAVPRNYIPAVEAGVFEALDQGPGGHPVIDVSVVLKDGKHHSVDSSDFAFRTAGRNAVREALASVGTTMLQPIMQVQIEVPSVFAGGLVPTVSALKGQVLGFEAHPTAAGWDRFDCLLAESALDGLFNALASATRGTAWFTSAFSHHEEMREAAAASGGNASVARAR